MDFGLARSNWVKVPLRISAIAFVLGVSSCGGSTPAPPAATPLDASPTVTPAVTPAVTPTASPAPPPSASPSASPAAGLDYSVGQVIDAGGLKIEVSTLTILPGEIVLALMVTNTTADRRAFRPDTGEAVLEYRSGARRQYKVNIANSAGDFSGEVRPGVAKIGVLSFRADAPIDPKEVISASFFLGPVVGPGGAQVVEEVNVPPLKLAELKPYQPSP